MLKKRPGLVPSNFIIPTESVSVGGLLKGPSELFSGMLNVSSVVLPVTIQRLLYVQPKHSRRVLKLLSQALLASWECPRLCTIFGYLVDGHGRPSIVMEKNHHTSLADLLRQDPEGLDATLATSVISDVACALAQLHAAGTSHLDVTPHTVIIDDAGLARLCSNGVAAAAAAAGVGDGPWSTPAFMAPECLARDSTTPPSPASDVWSLACIAVCCFTGRPPALAKECPSSPEVPRQIPLPLRTLLERCFSDHPEDRPSAENVAKAADAGLASDGIATESPRPSVADIMSALLTLGFPVAGVVRAFQRRLAQGEEIEPKHLLHDLLHRREVRCLEELQAAAEEHGVQEVDLCWGELALSEGERVLLARPGVTLQNGTLVGSGEGSSAPLVDIQADRCALKGLTVRGGGAGAAVEVRQARGVVLMECAVESCFGAGLLACGDIVNVDVIDTTFKGLGGPCVAAHQGADIRMSGAGLGPGSAGVLATGSGTTVQAEDVSFQTCSTGLCISSGAYAQVTRCTFEDQVGPCVSASGVGTRAELAGAVVSGETRGLFGWASVAFSAENGATVWAKKGCVFRGRTRATHGGKVILPLSFARVLWSGFLSALLAAALLLCYDVLLRARFVPPELDSHAQGLTAGACDTLAAGWMTTWAFVRGALAPLNERSGGQVYAAVDQMGAFFGTVLSCALALVSAVWARRGLIAAPAARLLVATAEQVRRHLEPFRVDTGLGA